MKCPTCKGAGKVPSGHDLRRLRKRAGLTIAQVSDRMSVSKPYLSQIETGKKRLTAEFAKAFGKAVKGLSS